MRYTPAERRLKLLELAARDPACQQTSAECDETRARFERAVGRLPKSLCRFLWAYPTAAHVAHHRLLDLVCEVMRFPEED